jgi:argonaute-like protein implicated in RNA metabolism and viral defense
LTNTSLGELDILLDFEEIVIGIEVKLYSGLSSDDGVDNSVYDYVAESSHQLSRVSRILNKRIMGTKKSAFLIFIAPEYNCYPICKEAFERNIIEDSVVIGYLPWEEILAVLENEVISEELTKYEKLIIQDLIELLKKRQKSRLLSNEFSGIFRDGSFCSRKESAHKTHKAECSKFQVV